MPNIATGFRRLAAATLGLAASSLFAGGATAQTYGIATMQPGTLSHTSASAIAKVLKEKGAERAGAADRRRDHPYPDGQPRRG